jgi:hypothetical protein
MLARDTTLQIHRNDPSSGHAIMQPCTDATLTAFRMPTVPLKILGLCCSPSATEPSLTSRQQRPPPARGSNIAPVAY